MRGRSRLGWDLRVVVVVVFVGKTNQNSLPSWFVHHNPPTTVHHPHPTSPHNKREERKIEEPNAQSDLPTPTPPLSPRNSAHNTRAPHSTRTHGTYTRALRKLTHRKEKIYMDIGIDAQMECRRRGGLLYHA